MAEEKKSNLEKFIPILIVVVVVMAFGIGVLWQKVSGLEKGGSTTTNNNTGTTATAPTAPPAATLAQIKDLWSKDIIKFGDTSRKVLFVEVSDPSCPFCQIAGGKNPELSTGQFQYVSAGGSYVPPVPEMKKLVDAGKASFAWIYYPGHGNGEMGAKALYCAFDQNRFWQVSDLLMSNAGYNLLNNTIKNDKTQSQALADFLKTAVDPVTLKTCLDSGKYDARLTADTALAEPLFPPQGGTPNFYINATNYDGAQNYTTMKPTVDAALK